MHKLKVIDSEKRKGVFKPSCTVKLYDETVVFNDFVAIGMDDETGEVSALYFADALTLSVAIKILHEMLEEALKEVSEEDRLLIEEAVDLY